MITLLYKPVVDLTPAEHERIREIVQPYYTDANPLLERALNHNNYIYLSYAQERLAAFFMVAWETITVNRIERQALFLGLVCVDPNFRNMRLVSALYRQSVKDVTDWQARHSQNLIIWLTTATPVVWHLIGKIYYITHPTIEADYTQEVIAVAHAIRQRYYSHTHLQDNLFVLKAAATATRYAPSERTYLDQRTQTDSPTIFEQLGIDEPAGDRLLVLCTLPDEGLIHQHRQFLESSTRQTLLPV